MGLDGRFGDWDWGPPPLQYNLLEQWISSNYFINLPEMRKSVKRGWWSLLRCSVGAISEPSYKIRLRRQIAVKRYISTMSDTDREKNCNVSWKNGCLASWWRSVAPTERPQGGACNEIRRQPSHRHHPDPWGAMVSTEIVGWCLVADGAYFTLWLNSFSDQASIGPRPQIIASISSLWCSCQQRWPPPPSWLRKKTLRQIEWSWISFVQMHKLCSNAAFVALIPK